ncbi:MAG: ATP-dependent DNA helicase UvrD2 [Actinomycetota bacterium]
MDLDILSDLNDEQREAVLAVRGPVCILAGAGTGKTTTITRRIAQQVASGAFSSDEILAVTFTDKAAREMASRLKALGVAGVRAKTFHAEALAQVRRLGGDQPEILGSKAQILHGIAQRLPAPYKFMALRDLATEIEWAKNRRIPAVRYIDRLDGHQPPVPPDLMHRVYAEYEKRKNGAGRIDFEDLLERALQLLHDDPRALNIVHARYRAFTVDEYQDVNLLQQSLLEAWTGSRVDVCVVGDDHQSIFGFTGATPHYLLSFPERYASCRVFRLSTSYRSTPQVIEIANRLAPKLGGSTNPLRAMRQAGPLPTLRAFSTGAEEVAWITGEIRRLHDDGVEWEKIAVLHRINGRSEDFEEAFSRAAIPFQVRDGSFLRRPAARAVLNRLRHELDGDVTGAVERVAAAAGYEADLEGVASDDEATRQADLARLVRLAEEFGGTSLQAFVNDIRSRFTEDSEGRGVLLLTYHRAKGLEFDAVFLPRLEDKELPFALSRTDDELAEERRLLYVGITRARRHLYISHAASRDTERRKKPKPSPFLRDLVGAVEGSRPASHLNGGPSRFGGASDGPPRKSDVVTQVEHDPVFTSLRTWRLRVSRDAGVPAYVVFDNKTLALIALAKPGSRAALLAVPGVGPAKLDRYAEDVLHIVRSA